MKNVYLSLVIYLFMLFRPNYGAGEMASCNNAMGHMTATWTLIVGRVDDFSDALNNERVIRKFTAIKAPNESIKETYVICGDSSMAGFVHDYMEQIRVTKNSLGIIEMIDVLFRGQPGKTFRIDKNAIEHIRASLLRVLVGVGEIRWKSLLNKDVVLVPISNDLTVRLLNKDIDERVTEFARIPSLNADLRGHQLRSDLTGVYLPSTNPGARFVWVVGELLNPEGALMTFGFPVDETLGSEFNFSSWAKLIRDSSFSENTDHTLSEVVLSAKRTPFVSDETQPRSADNHLKNEWIWELHADKKGAVGQKVGRLKLQPFELSSVRLRDWMLKRFNIETDDADLLRQFPASITIHKTHDQISRIEAYYRSSQIASSQWDQQGYNTLHSLYLLLSVGALDSGLPEGRLPEDKVMPVGLQEIKFTEHAKIFDYTLDKKELIRSVSLGEVGLLRDNIIRVEWRRDVAFNDVYTRVFKGGISSTSESGFRTLRLHRMFYSDPNDLFSAPSLAFVGWCDADREGRDFGFWLTRQQPEPDYFVGLRQPRRIFLNSDRSVTDPSFMQLSLSAQVNDLVEWLPLNALNSVVESLVQIHKAQQQWKKTVIDVESVKPTWEAIEPFMSQSIDSLPRPLGGEYILGENIEDFPRYVQNKE